MVESTSVELLKREDADPLASDSVTVLAAVADPLRFSILRFLGSEGEQCVCDIQAVFPVAGNRMSYHLKTLRAAGLVTSDKRGRWVHYRVADGAARLLHDALPLRLGGDA